MEKNIDAQFLAILESKIRTVPDFPKKGIMFKDITPMMANPETLHLTSRLLVKPFADKKIDIVVGIESRGFLFGPGMAMNLFAGFVPIRKPNKLPADTIKESYELEYGTDTLEIHKDAIFEGANVIIHDDLIATGGSAKAATSLVKKLGGNVVGYSFLIELAFLEGKKALEPNAECHSLIVL